MSIRPIRTADDHAAALAEIAGLFAARPGTPEADRLEVLAILVADYERRTVALPPPDPVETLDFALRARGAGQADLAALLGSRSRASEILNRRRALTGEMIARIADAWSIPAELLSGPYRLANPLKRAAIKGAAALSVLVVLVAAAILGGLAHYGQDLPGVEILASRQAGPLHVPLADLPDHVVGAFLAAEDRHYFAHAGTDLPAILRAGLGVVPALLTGNPPPGGSTITQQLAKNLLLEGEGPTLARKVRQILLATRLEERFSKAEILELYLNAIYFGDGAYGIGPAARHYFGKPAAELTLAEAAALAALPKAPESYRFNRPENRVLAKARRDWVLSRMAEDGRIALAAARTAQSEPLVARP